MIQGGDPQGTGMGGSKETIKGEFRINGVNNPISHARGVISMARSQFPNSASSQFFICHADCKFLDGQYASFGKVVEGMDTVDAIAEVATDYNDRPLKEQKMKKSVLWKSVTGTTKAGQPSKVDCLVKTNRNMENARVQMIKARAYRG